MKSFRSLKPGTAAPVRRARLFLPAALLALAWSPSFALAEVHFRQVNLVSDQPGVAQLQDPLLVNAWGLGSSASSPFWVSDNGTGVSTLYTVTNDAADVEHVSKVGLTVAIPGEGTVSGQFFNTSTGFNTNAFIFVSEDGTISGWRPALGTTAEVLATRSNAVYKGATLAGTASHPLLLAANFAEGTVDAYDGTMQLVTQFTDCHAPAGYAPFNVQSVDGLIFVTFAKQDAEKHDDAAGRGHGLIDVLNPETGRFHRFVTGSDAGGKFHDINSPWGVALAPDSFGSHAGQLLVGNFGSGTIMTFDAEGKFRGFLKGEHQGPLVINGLWALRAGNGGRGGDPDAIYFSAGPDGESHGLFGSLYPVKEKKDRDNEDGDNDERGGRGD
jgi:uncharacterized protein (TIGR03118 family)